jgi:hypothetical protein
MLVLLELISTNKRKILSELKEINPSYQKHLIIEIILSSDIRISVILLLKIK